MKILSLQPFFGGSHRNFNDGWVENSRHDWTVISLPDRHWKWRMRHAPLEFAAQIAKRKSQGQYWEAITCTDMLDVAAFKGLVDLGPTPLTVYFHENQFAYPNQKSSESDLHFAFTNFTTMVAADRVWFNSQFNMDATLNGADRLLKRFPDYQPLEQLADVRKKTSVHPPGVIVSGEAPAARPVSDPIVITWAARWEHDKGPNQLEEFLHGLVKQGVDFRINIVGQSYRNQPPAFEVIRQAYGDKIDAWGFQPRAKYLDVLNTTDVIFSTADHEFFGLSVVEAVTRGAMPLVPNRLAYPEVIGAMVGEKSSRFLYDGLDDAIEKLQALALMPLQIKKTMTLKCRESYGWQSRATALDAALC